MAHRILVINPNSDRTMTAWIDESLEPLRSNDGPEIVCTTLEGTPIAIETETDSASVVLPLCERMRREEERTSAFVIACFGDPGLHAAREQVSRPVFGICEAGLTTAINLGARVGILYNLPADLVPGMRRVRMLGLEDRVVGGRSIDVPIGDLGDELLVSERMVFAARQLEAELQVDVMVFGCAGMTRYRNGLEDALGLPVVDPSQAAVGLAISAVKLDYWHAGAADRPDEDLPAPRGALC